MAGKGTRFDTITGQTQDVSPVVIRTGQYRFVRTAPLIFSAADPHVLYLGSSVVFRTTNGGHSWDVISPDLARPEFVSPPNLGALAKGKGDEGTHRGVIYSLAPSPLDVNVLWAGTDDGLIWVTRDGGKNWANVTPPDLTPWSKVTQLDASHFDTGTVYAAVSRFRVDDLHAYIYATHDGGKTWQKITSGLPDNAAVNTVREDPVRKGLLFAGTERAVWVSFNDGDSWQSLQLNLPATSVRDLVIHGDDVVVGTHGRSFWILDDITPLRQIDRDLANSDAVLFKPGTAYRVRRDIYPDTPLPPEVPAGKNPPDGAIFDYYLKSNATSGREAYGYGFERKDRAQLCEHGQAGSDVGAARQGSERAAVLDSASSDSFGGSGNAPLRVGSAHASAGIRVSRLSDFRDSARHAAVSAGSVDSAGNVYGEA